MPIGLIVIGLALVISGVKDTYADLGTLIKGDFTGPNNFTTWLVALGLIGALGYVKVLRPFANAFLVLVVLVIILKNSGVFDQLKNALAAGPTSTPAKPPPNVSSQSASNSSGVSAGNVVSMAEAAAMFA